MPRKGNRCTTMVNFQLTPLEATALQAVVVHLKLSTAPDHHAAFVLGVFLSICSSRSNASRSFGRWR